MTSPAPEAGELAGRHLLLGVTGGVAAFKCCCRTAACATTR
jgi:phosphopantothenoylcysteine synthetase/decarboxylase